MAAKPKFIEPKEIPKWMIDGQKAAVKKARLRIQFLTAIAEEAITKAALKM